MKYYAVISMLLVGLFGQCLTRGESPPNVIVILADDMARGDLSAYNKGLSRTPRLDQMMRESVNFTHAYAGSPVCAPSRAALLTGRFPHRTGSVTLNQLKFPELTRLRLDEITLADRFAYNGYATCLIGKWHSGPGEDYHPLKRGFDEFIGFKDSEDIKTYYEYRLDFQGKEREFEVGNYLTEEFTAHAIDFVRRHQAEPFFLHLCHYAPHRPLSAPADLIQHFQEKGLDENVATVYAMIEVMDRGVGQLLDELDTLGLSENTIVIFTSDNGPDPLVGERFNLESRGTKYMVNEGGIRVPFFLQWKGTLAPTERSELIHFTDVVPTMSEICGLEEPPNQLPLDGVSFAGLLSENFSPPKFPRHRFWQWNRKEPLYSHNAAIREGNWKLVRPFVTKNFPKGESELEPRLYDLSTDPGEEKDLAPENPDLRDRLNSTLNRWSETVETDRTRP